MKRIVLVAMCLLAVVSNAQTIRSTFNNGWMCEKVVGGNCISSEIHISYNIKTGHLNTQCSNWSAPIKLVGFDAASLMLDSFTVECNNNYKHIWFSDDKVIAKQVRHIETNVFVEPKYRCYEDSEQLIKLRVGKRFWGYYCGYADKVPVGYYAGYVRADGIITEYIPYNSERDILVPEYYDNGDVRFDTELLPTNSHKINDYSWECDAGYYAYKGVCMTIRVY